MSSRELEKGIIVSIQGLSLNTTQQISDKLVEVYNEFSEECENAGAVGLRLDKPIKTDLPVIGLIKTKQREHYKEPYITYTLDDVKQVSKWADYVAVDYRRCNPNLQEISNYAKNNNIKIVADIACIYDYFNVKEKNYHYDFLATTLSVFFKKRPDLWLVKELIRNDEKVIAEGNYENVKDVVRVAGCGVHNVCIGKAITGFFKKTREFSNAFSRGSNNV